MLAKWTAHSYSVATRHGTWVWIQSNYIWNVHHGPFIYWQGLSMWPWLSILGLSRPDQSGFKHTSISWPSLPSDSIAGRATSNPSIPWECHGSTYTFQAWKWTCGSWEPQLLLLSWLLTLLKEYLQKTQVSFKHRTPPTQGCNKEPAQVIPFQVFHWVRLRAAVVHKATNQVSQSSLDATDWLSPGILCNNRSKITDIKCTGIT